MSKKEILKYLLEINTNMSVQEVVFCLLFAFGLGLIIYLVYKFTYSGTVYSKDFNVSLILMTVITASIMIIIGSNLALSLGLVGSLSIVRFRSAVKENRDMVFIFWAISAGLACGAEVFSVGVISVIVISIIMICMSGKRDDNKSFLIVIHGKELDTESLQKELAKKAEKIKLRMHITEDSHEEITYEIMLKKSATTGDIVNTVRNIQKVDTVNLVSFSGEMVG